MKVKYQMSRQDLKRLWEQYREWSDAMHQTKLQIDCRQYDSLEELALLEEEWNYYHDQRESVYEKIQNAVIIE